MPQLTDNVTFADLAKFLGVGEDPAIESFSVTPGGRATPQVEPVSTTAIVTAILLGKGLFDWVFGGGHVGSCGAFRDLVQGLFVASEPVRDEFQGRANNFIRFGTESPPVIVDEYLRFVQTALIDMDALFDEFKGSNLLGATMANTRYDQWLTRWLTVPMLFFTNDWAWQHTLRQDGELTNLVQCCAELRGRMKTVEQRTTTFQDAAQQIPQLQQGLQSAKARLDTIELTRLPGLQRQINDVLAALQQSFQPQLSRLQNQMGNLLADVLPGLSRSVSQNAFSIDQIQQTMARAADLEQVRSSLASRIESVNELRQLGDEELQREIIRARIIAREFTQGVRDQLRLEARQREQRITQARNTAVAEINAEINRRVGNANAFTRAVRDNLRREANQREARLSQQINAVQQASTAWTEARFDQAMSRFEDLRRFAQAVRDQARAFNIATNQSLQRQFNTQLANQAFQFNSQLTQAVDGVRQQVLTGDAALQQQLDGQQQLINQRWTQTKELVAARAAELEAFVIARDNAIQSAINTVLGDIQDGIIQRDQAIFGQAFEADLDLQQQLRTEFAAVRAYIDARDALVRDAVQGWIADSEAAALVREAHLEQRLTDFVLEQVAGGTAVEQLIQDAVAEQTAGLRDFLLANDEQIRLGLQDELDSAIQSVNDTFSPQIARLTDGLALLDQQLQTGLADVTQQFTSELDRQTLETRQLFDSRLTDLDTQLQSEIDRIRAEGADALEAEIARIEGEISQLQQQLTGQQQTLDLRLGQIDQQIAEIQQQSIPALRQQLLDELLQLQQDFTAADTALQNQLNDVTQQLQEITGQQLVSLQSQITDLWTLLTETIVPLLTTHGQLITDLQTLVDQGLVPRIDQNEICCDALTEWRTIQVDPTLVDLRFDVDVLNQWRTTEVDVFITNTTTFVQTIDQTIINALKVNCDQVLRCIADAGEQIDESLCDFGQRAWGTMAECWLNLFTPAVQSPIEIPAELSDPLAVVVDLGRTADEDESHRTYQILLETVRVLAEVIDEEREQRSPFVTGTSDADFVFVEI